MPTTSTATAEEEEGAGRLALPEAPARRALEAIEGRKGAVVAEGTVRPVPKVLAALTVQPVREVLPALTVRPVRKVLPALTVRPVGGDGADLRGLRVVVKHPAWT